MSSLPEIKNKLNEVIGAVKTRGLNALEIQTVKSVNRNFEAGGRPKWIPSKKKGKLKGTKTLRVTGTMSRVSAVKNVSLSTVSVITNPVARAYSRIHQEGGVINHPGGTRARRSKRNGRSVFARKNRETGRAKKVDVSFIKPYKITIPARPFMTFNEAGKKELLDAVVQAIKI